MPVKKQSVQDCSQNTHEEHKNKLSSPEVVSYPTNITNKTPVIDLAGNAIYLFFNLTLHYVKTMFTKLKALAIELFIKYRCSREKFNNI